jgi:hypothetical protein
MSAGGFAIQLREYRGQLSEGYKLSVPIIEHVAGKLGWFCEVVQSGRLYVHWIWSYLESTHFVKREIIQGVILEFDWWIKRLELWADDTNCGGQYPILSGSELLLNPHTIELCQSDASGTDGFGYVSSTLDAIDFDWFSTRWTAYQLGLPKSSHQAEIRALHSFLLNRNHDGVQLVIWITDSESACYSINRANCKDANAFPLLLDIYNRCDAIGLQLVALWVPREFNTLTDHLSHLASLLCRDTVEGRGLF